MKARSSYIAVASFTLALACGAFVLVYAVGRGLWSWSTPIERPDRVVAVLHADTTRGGGDRSYFGPPGLERLQETGVFESVSGHILTDGSGADFRSRLLFESVGRAVETVAVHHRYFSVLGVSVRGRDFRAEDDRDGAEAVAIISDRLWRSAFLEDESVVGAVVPASPMAIRIVGIAPAGFRGARLGEATDLWVPSGLMPRLAVSGRAQGNVLYQAIGRIRDGVTVESASQALMDMSDGRRPYMAVPLNRLFGAEEHQTVVVESDGVLRFLPIAGGLVLLAGFATLTSLATVHYEARRREFAIRGALGASIGRIALLLVRETGLIVLLGLAGAVGVVGSGLKVIPSVTLPTGVDLGRLDYGLDWRLMVLSAVVSVVGLSLALVGPLFRAAGHQLAREALVTSRTGSRSSQALERVALGVQSAASVALVVLAVLFGQTVSYAQNDSVGFDVDPLVFINARVQRETVLRMEAGRFVSEITNVDARESGLRALIDDLSRTPGVQAVALGFAPLGPIQAAWAGRAGTAGSDVEPASRFLFGSVAANYFNVLGVPLVAGSWSDTVREAERPPVAITESLAHELWPGESPLGKTLGDDTVVAVVRDFTIGLPSAGTQKALFRLAGVRQAARAAQFLLTVQAASDATALAPTIERVARDAFPEASSIDVEVATTVVATDVGRQRLGWWFVSLFGLVVLVLCASSILGIVDRYAEARRRELAIRLALGAPRDSLSRMVAKQALLPVAGGVVLGLVAGAIGARLFVGLFLGVGPLEPTGYIAAVGVTLAVSGLGIIRAGLLVRGLSIAPCLRSE
jgi:putative ABC transport system permease protein